MFAGFASTVLVKVLAASVALAAVGTGVGVVANQAAPGDPLYGIDQALEQIGIGDGGVTERVQEAQRLIVKNHVAEGLRHAGDAIAQLPQPPGQPDGVDEALRRASDALDEAGMRLDQIPPGSPGYADAQQLRKHAGDFLDDVARQVESGEADLNEIADQAGLIIDDARELARQIRRDREGTRSMETTTETPTTTIVTPVPPEGEPTQPILPTTPTTIVPPMPTNPTGMRDSGNGLPGGIHL